MRKIKQILKCINRNAMIAFCFTLLLGVFGYLYIRNFKKLSEGSNKQIYSLIEGTINDEKTYFLILTDSLNISLYPPKIIIDSSIIKSHTNNMDNFTVSLDGSNLLYDKEAKDLKPLILEIKKNSGYQISGVISNDLKNLDTLK